MLRRCRKQTGTIARRLIKPREQLAFAIDLSFRPSLGIRFASSPYIEANCTNPRRSMSTASRFETLTRRKVLIEERTHKFVSDLRRLVHLLDVDIDLEEKRTGISDLASRNYSVVARGLRARRDNLTATISRLERSRAIYSNPNSHKGMQPIPKRPAFVH